MADGISWDQLLEQAGNEVPESYDPLPEAEYEFEVVEATHQMTKGTPSKNMWKVQAKVVDNPDPQWNNRRVFDNIVLSPDNDTALSIFFQQMGVLGLNRAYFATKPQVEAVAAALKGRRFRGKVIQKPYQGEIQNEIKRYKPSRSGAVAAPPAGAVAPTAGVPAPPVPGAAPAAPTPPPAPPVQPQAAPAPPPPPPAAPAPTAPAPATPQAAAEDPWAAPPAPAPAAPEAAVPPPPPLQNLPF